MQLRETIHREHPIRLRLAICGLCGAGGGTMRFAAKRSDGLEIYVHDTRSAEPENKACLRKLASMAVERKKEEEDAARVAGGGVEAGGGASDGGGAAAQSGAGQAAGGDAKELSERIRSGGVDWVTFASPSSVRAFFEQIQADLVNSSSAKVASIGPVTSDELRRFGVRVDVTAKEHTIDGLLAAIEEACG